MVKIRIEVSYLEGVEDPEASTLQHNLGVLGYDSIDKTRILKIYELSFAEDEHTALGMAKAIAENLLINPVINKYDIIILGEE
ncbi:MAG: phosphoribosylformylglycinamidine synthase subunit PurS [Candidatus Thermoplasmatota archaeon]|jgi:phosphoribosylformylglycinamidine synthase|nr:phosphoribosylformylglycinamidine synthase subunit PurS [Candidatus Thermoplasmatota archaeon]MCL5988283.1 phosphoribosylformylglycinamidine synthase subunit PurS [Candidatus Thermoplasmatota archaeon]